ncbi:MAG: EB domain-containing protein, partial [Polyangia bacterium]|nr:EB domain-containing protein [Polyangia bacterium]
MSQVSGQSQQSRLFQAPVWLVSSLLVYLVLPQGCVGVAYDPPRHDAQVDSSADAMADGEAPDPCEGVSCGVGTCVVIGQEPDCLCPTGFHAEDLSCVADPPPDPCENTQCGENAHCDHGVCICDDGYEGNPVTGCTPISTQNDLCRAELVNIAMAELGYCEGTDSRPYMQYQPGYWCYDFVAWVYEQSSCSPPSPLSLPRKTVGSLPAGWRPAPGDLIKFTIQH